MERKMERDKKKEREIWINGRWNIGGACRSVRKERGTVMNNAATTAMATFVIVIPITTTATATTTTNNNNDNNAVITFMVWK